MFWKSLIFSSLSLFLNVHPCDSQVRQFANSLYSNNRMTKWWVWCEHCLWMNDWEKTQIDNNLLFHRNHPLYHRANICMAYTLHTIFLMSQRKWFVIRILQRKRMNTNSKSEKWKINTRNKRKQTIDEWMAVSFWYRFIGIGHNIVCVFHTLFRAFDLCNWNAIESSEKRNTV